MRVRRYCIRLKWELNRALKPFYLTTKWISPKHITSLQLVSLITSDDFDDPEMKENSEFIFSAFHALLDLRGAGGYSYESSYSRQFFTEKGQQYAKPEERILEMVKKQVLGD